MREGSEGSSSSNQASTNKTDIETRLSWNGGSVLFKAVPACGDFHREFLRNDLAIGVINSRDPKSRQTWWLDGHLALDKKDSSLPISSDVILVPPGCEFKGAGHGGSQGFWLFLEPQFIRDDEQLKCLTERPAVDCVWSKDRMLRSIVSAIRKECLSAFPSGPMFLEESAMGLLTHFVAQTNSIPTRSLSNRNLQIITDYIESNLDRRITLSELAVLVGLTPKYFCEAFKRTTGRPPHQFQLERRIDRARILLCDPNLRLKNVASMVGFENQNRFNNYFLRIIGVSVASYRRGMREK